MTYGDQAFRFRGEGFRDEPELPPEGTTGTPVYRPGTYNPDEYVRPAETASSPQGRAVTAAELDDVFDDPQLGEPGMDRMAVHVLWEIVLAVATIGLALWFYQSHRAAMSGAGLRTLLVSGAVLGFLTIGVGLSLRAGVVNLAVGPTAAASALFFATHVERGVGPTIGITLLLAAGVGVAVGLLSVVMHVPAWASGLAAGFALVVWLQRHSIPTGVTSGYHPDRHAFYWYGGFAALALLGGFLGLVKPIRRGLGRFRPVADPARRRGAGAAIVALLALIGSSLLAGVAGILAALSSDLTSIVSPTDGFVTTGLALGTALVGGTSAFGRRGGVFGSLLAATLLVLAISYAEVAHLRVSPYALAAGAIAAGLVVTRLVEAFGRPHTNRSELAEEDDPWDNRGREEETGNGSSGTAGYSGPSGTAGYSPRQGGWTSQLPARSNDDTWGGAADNRWGAR